MRCVSVALALLGLATTAAAHQPVMDMAPRWQDGFGVQVRQEYRFSNELLTGDNEVANPFGRKKRVLTTWFEGVYTFRREVRATLKLPIVDQERVSLLGGLPVRQRGSGVGDLVLGVPLKKYWNLSRGTVNVGLTPSLRMPTGSTRDDYPVGDGSWDFGLSAAVSAESTKWYGLLDLFWWANTEGKKGIESGDVYGIDFNLGYHAYHHKELELGAFTMLDFEWRERERGLDTAGVTGGGRVTLGPVLVGYWRNFMLRGEVKVPVHERVIGTQVSRGVLLNVGLGVAF